MCVCVCEVKTEAVSESLAPTLFPLRNKRHSNEALSCSTEETVEPPGRQDDVEDCVHSVTHVHTY